jgi:hypothetical protein
MASLASDPDSGVPWYALFASADEYLSADSSVRIEPAREPEKLSAHPSKGVGQNVF